MTDSDSGLLAGVRILDFTRMFAGPYCTGLLADLGAEVIKVEALHGDDQRHLGLPVNGESTIFGQLNRNKKSIRLNLKTPEGLELAQQLAAKSDVVIENYRVGVAERLGIGYAQLLEHNPSLVYCSISGFGQSGPLAERPSYDVVAQAMSGLMSITGKSSGPPTLVGESFGDISAGMFAAWGISSALFNRERTGQGSYVDVAMFDSLLSMLTTSICEYVVTGNEPQRHGNQHRFSAPFGAYQAQDGHFIIAIANNSLFQRFGEGIGQAGLIEDARFTNDVLRGKNRDALTVIIEDWAAEKTVQQVVDQLSQIGIPTAPIWSVAEAVSSEQAQHRQLISEFQHPLYGTLKVCEQPVNFSGQARGQLQRSPILGEHEQPILSELLGIQNDELQSLRDKGIIGETAA